MAEKINHWKCSVCGTQLTYMDQDLKVNHHVHFDITRFKKVLCLEDKEIEEDIENSNMKMQRFICESCFIIILNESNTLGKLFLDGAKTGFIY